MAKNEIVTRIARIWLTHDGIVRGEVRRGAELKLDDAKDIISGVARISGSKKRPHLVLMRGTKFIDRKAREHFSKEGGSVITAVGVVLGEGITHVIANFFLGLNKPSVPFKTFATESEAIEWLKQYR